MKKRKICLTCVLTMFLCFCAVPMITKAADDAVTETYPSTYTGWYLDEGTGEWYYYDADGTMATNWRYIDGYWYFFTPFSGDTQGCMVKDCARGLGGNYYYFTSSGQMLTDSWFTYEGAWSYAGSDGAALTGWQLIDGYWYYFDINHMMLTDDQWFADDTYYVFDPSGYMYSDGWYYGKSMDMWFHLQANGVADAYVYYDAGNESWDYYNIPEDILEFGWKLIDGYWYYFDPSYGVLMNTILHENNNVYVFGPFGALVTGGWYKDYYTEEWYYTDAYGVAATGWQLINGYWYYFDENGIMMTGEYYLDGHTYLFDPSGYLYADCWTPRYDNSQWYYSRADGVVEAVIFYSDSINRWMYKTFEDGGFPIGWQLIEGYWYYFAGMNGMYMAESMTIDGYLYVFGPFGALSTGGWVTDGNKWWYTDSYGVAYTGWQWIDGYCYYFNPYTGIMETNTVIDGYEIGPDGIWHYDA